MCIGVFMLYIVIFYFDIGLVGVLFFVLSFKNGGVGVWNVFYFFLFIKCWIWFVRVKFELVVLFVEVLYYWIKNIFGYYFSGDFDWFILLFFIFNF